MKMPAELPPLLESFFTQRLMAQRKVSPHTRADLFLAQPSTMKRTLCSGSSG